MPVKQNMIEEPIKNPEEKTDEVKIVKIKKVKPTRIKKQKKNMYAIA